MSLQVAVISATNVPNPESFGKCDPYAAIEFQGIRKKTDVIKGELNPTWNKSFEFELVGNGVTADDQLKVTIFDWERVGRNRQLGTATVALREFIQGGSRTMEVALIDQNQRPQQASTVKLNITCKQPASAQGKSTNAGGTVVDLDQGDEEDDEEDEVDGGGDQVDGGTKSKKKKKKRRSRVREELSTKPTDQQIRVKVVQARQLMGANLQPVVRVSVHNQMKQTRIKKSTTSPWWDESFFFNFHIPPSELIDEIVDFSVYNSKTLRSDALIGSFKCDVGLIYDEPQHALVNKWVLLSDPEDATSGARGYLKISACVLGPGDTSPNMQSKPNDEDEDIESNLLRPAGVQLRPATFTLRVFHAEDIPRMDSAFFEGVKKILRIGEEQKELVDPYFVFSFAGKEARSKIMYANDHPDWYQELSLGLQFPSMCERLKFQIKDWDRLNRDDYVGTHFQLLGSISASGEDVIQLFGKKIRFKDKRFKKKQFKDKGFKAAYKNLLSTQKSSESDEDSSEDEMPSVDSSGYGFLPTFGPSYVNFYGSTREYSDLPDDYEDLNLGKGGGVAYRGRALLQLSTTLGELPENSVVDITGDDRLRVQKYMRRRKYRVHAAFLNASMISSSHVDAPIEFEVSIGNYGNKLDEHVPPSPSTTQPTNAVFDGCYYYFLPWAATKPCVVVDCSWEDISFRLESLNILLAIQARLESNLMRVHIGVQAKLPMPELAQLLISLLDTLIHDCRNPLSPARDGEHVTNELDRLMIKQRLQVLQLVKDQAVTLRDNATNLEEAISEVENLLAMIKNIAIEPQNSMPDVIIWMISGQKRIAYYRIPANELLYSNKADRRGKLCGTLMTIALKYPHVRDKDKKKDMPAVVRVKLWLGLQTQEAAWHKMQSEGELAVYAETYQNEVNILGTWTNKGPTMTRPKWSDSEGRIDLKKEDFSPPPGWTWEGQWYVSPELSMLFDKDAGHNTYLEDIYECHSRKIPGGSWGPATRPWADVKGDPTPDKASVPLPEGWKWDDDWQIDLNRAVDEDGWEYCVEATVGGYGPVEKTYHLCRRRRWLRPRTFVEGVNKKKERFEEQKKKQVEGWEYAPLFNMKFHAQERTMDLVRRRRWHRKMVSQGQGGACFFNVQHELKKRRPLAECTDCLRTQEEMQKDAERLVSLAAPRMFLTYKSPHKFQLRAYIYQARDVIAADDSGLSDPFARVCFHMQSMVTDKVQKSLSPTWDQTLIFGEIELYGDPKNMEGNPPEVYIELFDYDTFGKPEFLGRTKALPMVKLDAGDARTPVLQWYPIKRLDQDGGELLAAFELIKMNGKDLPFLPPKRGDLYIVPNGIRPIMQRTGIEVLCWGVRNMKKFQLSAVSSPSVRFECGGHIQDSIVIKDTKRNPNFSESLLFFDVMLPREELYMPPMNIRVKDHRQFGRRPTVGVHILKSLEEFRCEPLSATSTSVDPKALPPPPTNGEAGGMDGGIGPEDTIIDIPDEGKPKEKWKLIRWWRKRWKFNLFQKLKKTIKGKHPKKKSSIKTNSSDENKPVLLKDLVLLDASEGGYNTNSTGADSLVFDNANNSAFLGWIFRRKKKKKKSEEIDLDLGSELTKQELDWWSKYYASTNDLDKCKKYTALGYDTLKMLPDALEKDPMFQGFQDFCSTFPLTRGKNEDDEDDNVIGEFKGSFRVYPLPPDPNEPLPVKIFQALPPSDPEECIIRVYVVKAVDLQPQDPNGLADPYVEVELGKKKMSTQDNYIPNTICPVFGRLFEMKAIIPLSKDLTVRVKDYDLLSSDDTIGETTIDLENRYLSKYRATIGLPKTYWTSGINQWRDCQKPRQILEEYCERHHLGKPAFNGTSSVRIGPHTYQLIQFEKKPPDNPHFGPEDERLALHVLNTFPLVKEHVESRQIFNPLQPNIEQGRLHMWVDIFPKSLGPPGAPFDITPRQPAKFQLRVVIWNTVDVILEEESITGEKMSDIYVQGWMGGIDQKQKTDVHYRSLDGEGNFNWRFVFPFEYQIAEQTMVVKKKEHFWSLDETELRTAPKFIVQIWDNDRFSKDDFIGHLELDLNAMPLPARRSRSCKLSMLPDAGREVKLVSLFEMKHMRGFWPCFDETTGTRELTGKVEMEVELITGAEAEERPAGEGREEPNMHPTLEPPKRPETSFLWFTSPFKTLKYVLWRNYKWCIIFTLIFVLIFLLVALFIYSFPGNISRWMMGV